MPIVTHPLLRLGFLLIFLLGFLLPFESLIAASSKKIKPTSKKNPIPRLTLKGQTFRIKVLPVISLPSETEVLRRSTKPSMESASPRDSLRLKMPELMASTSSPSPALPSFSRLTPITPWGPLVWNVSWNGINKEPILPSPWKLPPLEAAEPQVSPAHLFSEGEFKILEAQLLLRSPETSPLSIGLANPLLDHLETKNPAHLILGSGYANLQIRSPAMTHFRALLQSEKSTDHKDRIHQGLRGLLSLIQSNDYEWSDFLTPYLAKGTLPAQESLGNWPLAQARGALDKKDLPKAWTALNQVDPHSAQASEAQFLKSMVYYRSNQFEESKKELESLWNQKDQLSKDLKSLTAATLAKLYFQEGQYAKASEVYRWIDQDHPLWIESLVENAWAQILNKDYEGAAGNMFSLHTTYFKGAYNPESYIVRTVSYLQLCQFGDALSVLQDFLKKYKFAQQQLATFKQKGLNSFETLRDFLKAGMPKFHEGLPRSLLVEIARHPQFIERQKKINELEQDGTRMNQLGAKLEELDQKFQQGQLKYTQLLQALEGHQKKNTDPTKKEALALEKQNLLKHLLRFDLLRKILLDAKNGIVREEKSFMHVATLQKNQFKTEQAQIIKTGFAQLENDLNHWLDQSELLYYEIHNGAGEHLRYQMASANDSRSPSSAKTAVGTKKDDKNLKWDFDGEIWEDEVGHYRSSLKNVCPEQGQTKGD